MRRCRQLFAALDRCEETLSRQRFIAGDRLTEADVRLFQTLIRFDEVYVVYFKTNRNFIREMPNLKNYVRELYQTPGQPLSGSSAVADHQSQGRLLLGSIGGYFLLLHWLSAREFAYPHRANTLHFVDCCGSCLGQLCSAC